MVVESKEEIQVCFNEAIRCVYVADYENFVLKIASIYDQISCNCFFREQDKNLWDELLAYCVDCDGQDEDLNFCLFRIFVSIYSKFDKNDIIQRDIISCKEKLGNSWLPYLFSALKYYEVQDAIEAVNRHACAYSYFVLSNCFDTAYDKEQERSRKYILLNNKQEALLKVLEYNSNAACVYNNLSFVYKELRDVKKQILYLEKCIELNPRHWSYYHLINAYLQEDVRDYEKALNYLEKAKKNKALKTFDYFKLRKKADEIKWKIFDEKQKQIEKELFSKEKYFAHEMCLLALEKNADKFDNILKELSEEKSQIGIDIRNICMIAIWRLFTNEKYDIVIWFVDFLNAGKFLELRWDPIMANDGSWNAYFKAILKNHDKNASLVDENLKIRLESNKTRIKYYENYSLLGFGKYKGKSVDEIFHESPNYIYWCLSCIDHFFVNPSYLFKKSDDKWYYRALVAMLTKEEIQYSQFKEGFYQGTRSNKYDEISDLDTDWNLWNDNLDWDQQDAEFWDQF